MSILFANNSAINKKSHFSQSERQRETTVGSNGLLGNIGPKKERLKQVATDCERYLTMTDGAVAQIGCLLERLKITLEMHCH